MNSNLMRDWSISKMSNNYWSINGLNADLRRDRIRDRKVHLNSTDAHTKTGVKFSLFL